MRLPRVKSPGALSKIYSSVAGIAPTSLSVTPNSSPNPRSCIAMAESESSNSASESIFVNSSSLIHSIAALVNSFTLLGKVVYGKPNRPYALAHAFTPYNALELSQTGAQRMKSNCGRYTI